ncbi:bifunctional oligoribonuclease/PAP phosphatase NrnA [candidate division KSB1 bacterium]|nr:bifunctional oligoribonuclease/PAP phosphatase NrnA [candidate division KSB1 bacterium]
MHTWHDLTAFLRPKQRLLITTHINPDGDAIGSQMALAHFLRQQGKEILLFNVDPTPRYFQFMDPTQEIMIFSDDTHHRQLVNQADGAIVVDVSDWSRLAHFGTVLKQTEVPVACIDHHIQTEKIGQIQIIDHNASSTGELVYDFLNSSNCKWTQEIIDALYTCIMTDTGSFRYQNTTAHAHQLASDLLQKGARFRVVFEQVYENYSKQRMVLMGHLLTQMKFMCQNRLAYFALTQALLRETGAELWETEGFSELPRDIAGVEISIMFTEMKNGTTKASFRSKGHIPINELAARVGGGGHLYASGATIPMSLDKAMKWVLKEAKTIFTSCN